MQGFEGKYPFDKNDRKILEKIECKSQQLENYVNINNGIVTGNDKKFLSFEKHNDNYKQHERD